MPTPKITVVGSSNVDLIMKVPRLPAKGETVTGGEFSQVFGGKGANQAVAAARAGGRVTFVSAVGNDAYADGMLANFTADGIDTTHLLRADDVPSGHALIMIGGDGDNCITVAAGANGRVDAGAVRSAQPAIQAADAVVLQNEIPLSGITEVLRSAHEAGVPVFWNFAPAIDCPPTLFGYAPHLIVNESEAEHLCGASVTDPDSAERAGRQLLDLGCASVVVTLGAQGAVRVDRRGTQRVAAHRVTAVDTTAAGDVFCGAWAVAQGQGEREATDALSFATAAAALAVQRLGAQPSIPYRGEIDALLG